MIKVYTDILKCNTENKINQADIFFNNRINGLMLNEECKKLMQLIDRAKLDNAKSGSITTPYGAANIRDLSTGCKTLLIAYLLSTENKEAVIDITECGSKVIAKIFEIIDNTNISVVLSHTDISRDMKYKYIVNDKYECDNVIDLCRKLVA